MKVCLVTSLYFPYATAGTERYVARMAEELARQGNEVSIVTTTPYDGLASLEPRLTSSDEVRVYRFFPLNFSHRSNGTGKRNISKLAWHVADTFNVHGRKCLERVLAREDPDIIHTNNLMGLTSLVRSLSANRPASHVHTLHDYQLLCLRSNLRCRAEYLPADHPRWICDLFAAAKRRTVGSPDCVISPSRWLLDRHQRAGYFDDTRSVVLPHGVAVKEPYYEEAKAFDALFVGRLEKEKGVSQLVDAFSRHTDRTLRLCGGGDLSDFVSAAADRAENIGYEGYVSDEELERLRKRARIAIVPSLWREPYGLVAHESLARGIPVLAPDVGGLGEIVGPDRGRLYTPAGPTTLATEVEALLSSDLGRKSRRAYEWAREHTIEEHVRTVVEEVYEPVRAGHAAETEASQR